MASQDLASPAVTGRASRSLVRFDSSRLVLYAFAALLCVLVILPMTWLVIYSVSTPRTGAFTLDNFRRLFTEPAFVDPLIITFTVAVCSSVICCAVAAPMGWLVARTDLPFSRTIRALVTASFVTPPFLGAIAWELLAAPNSGLLNKFFRFLTGAEMDQYLFNIYSLTGLIFVISCYTFPYVFVLIANSLDRMPGDLEDASSILGGRAWVTARKITIPLALPALLAGAIVAFLQATTLFGSPAILALPAGFHTMTTKIWSLFQYPPKPELAAAASLPLLIITVMLLRAEHFILGRRGYSVVAGKQSSPRLIPLGRLKFVALGVCFFVLLLPVILPYGALVNAAFAPVATTPLTFANATLRNFNFVFFELSATKPVLKNTFILGALAATIGTVLAVVIAYLTTRQAVRGYRVLAFLATAPIAIPGIVLGVGLFLSYTRPPFVLYGTIWVLLLAYLTIELPAAYQQLQSALRAVHPELEDASRILGATRMQALRQITAPLLRTSVIATWCFIFVSVIRELSAAIILFTSETKVVSVLIFDLKESGDLGAIAVLGLLMLLLTFAVVIFVNRIPGFGSGVRLRNT
jgi:iron(III) transport system permease protein